ncbi:MAG: hypothetical protein KGQ41_07945 [Alphaproteobacteria bacterium]|nr:hypothetical protein [Alphaproteobacteria bacterium]
MSEQMMSDEVIPHGEEIVERFGGIRPMAAKLNIPVTTVQGWKKRDAIPAVRRDEIVSAAQLHNIDLRGVLTDPANQNAATRPMRAAASSAMPEDPALTQTMEAPQQARPRPQGPMPKAATTEGYDMIQIRRMARNTSLITTVSLLVIVLGTGFLLFGGEAQSPREISSIEKRLTAVETRGGATSASDQGFVGRKLAELEQKVGDMQTVFGGDISTFAQQVAAGGGATLTQRLATLEQQLTGASNPGSAAPALTGMVDRMQGMNQTPQGRAEMQKAIDDLRSVVAGLQSRTDGLDVALSQAKTQSEALNQTFADISGRDLGAAAMLLALTQLRQSADRETPFTDDLELLRSIAQKTDPELAESVEKLAPYAESGILSPAGLQRELMAAANDIVSAKMKGEDISIKDKLMARMQGMFTIRKDGVPVAGGDEQALIKAASAQLDKGDVAGAMATLEKLNGPAAEAAQPWKNKAAATMVAQQLDMKLVSSLMQKIKTGFAGGASSQPINMAPAQTPMPAPQQAPQAIQPDMPAPTQGTMPQMTITQ